MKKLSSLIFNVLFSVALVGGSFIAGKNKVFNKTEIPVNKTHVENKSLNEGKVSRRLIVDVDTFSELQSELETADESTEIVVSEGIDLPDGCVLDGHGATIRVENPYIDEHGQINTTFTNQQYVFYIAPNYSVTLKNMIILGGKGSDTTLGTHCAAVHSKGNLVMENVTITRSYRGLFVEKATGSGAPDATAILKNCDIVRNAALYGGGIACQTGILVMDGCSLSENRTTSYYGGGAMEINYGGQLYANNTVIVNNSSSEIGGAINCNNSYINIINTTLAGNITTGEATCGGGLGMNTSAPLHAVNSISVDNYSYDSSSYEFTRSDVGLYSSASEGYFYNCVYGGVPTGSGETYVFDCKPDFSHTFATDYRDDGVVTRNGYTNGFIHPSAISKNEGLTSLYVPISSDGPAATGGVRTYFDYSDLTDVKMAFGPAEDMTLICGSTLPDSSSEVTTYYEGGTRNGNIIGASNLKGGNYHTVIVDPTTNGYVEGATIYGDSYLEGSEIEITAYGNEDYALEYWDVVGDTSTTVSSNPLVLVVDKDYVITPHFTSPSVTLTYNANGGSGKLPKQVNYLVDSDVVVSSLTPSKSCFDFLGWNTESDGSGNSYEVGDTFQMPNSNLTLYAQWDISSTIKEVINRINSIGVVSYTGECQTAISAARESYDALTESEKTYVTNYVTLVEAENSYLKLDLDHLAAQRVMDLIASIGEVKYDQGTSDRIDVAYDAYEALTIEQQALVTNYDVLEQAIDDYHTESVNHANAVPVMGFINDIGIVEDTSECYSKIHMARMFYNASSAGTKSHVENYDVLVAAETMYANLHAKNIVEGYISDIGEVTFTVESKAKIDTARSAYEALTGPQKDLMTNYDILLAAEAAYASLVNDDIAKSHVETLINAIGTVHYDEDTVARLTAARTAYNALTYEQRLLVSNYGVLEQAEIDYNFYYMDHQFSDPVEVLISEIGAVEYTDECKTKIDEARDAYDALFVEQKELVSNYSVLLEAEHAYSNLESANAVEVLVSSIGVVAYNQTSKEKIDAARAAYEALPGEQKDLVSNYSTLIAAETMYASLEENDYLRIYVESLIDAIGTVQYDDGISARIVTARDAYDDLTTTQKALVSNYSTLTTAESTYAALVSNHAAADPVSTQIAGIGVVEYTSASKTKIDAARSAYDSLTAEQKALVSNYSVLTSAESTYAAIKTNTDAADAVEALITSIGDVSYTGASKTKIDTARSAYESLTGEQKGLVENYATLTTAESTYAVLQEDNNLRIYVESLIDAIGTVQYDDGTSARISAARDAYDDLTTTQKALVSNYSTLTTAESTYAALVSNHAAADPVSTQIAGIGVVEYTSASKTKIDAARSAYNALTSEQKALVSNYDVLVNAEYSYANLGTSSNVESLISEIGTVEYNSTSKDKIDAAREAYEALTGEQKDLVSNSSTLTAAEGTYASKKADNEAKAHVEVLIDAIGEVENTEDCKSKIDEARWSYDQLSDEQKALVSNYNDLTNAEETYSHFAPQAIPTAFPVWGIILIIACGVLLVGNVLTFVILKKRK